MAEAGAPWQFTFKKLEQRCGHLLTSGLWSDCTFIVGSEVVVPAHKLVLAIASPVFEAMLYGVLAEHNEPMISIPDVQPEVFRALLQYIYTGNIKIRSFNMAWDLWYGAKKYMLPHLEKEIKEYILTFLDPKNACRSYEFACLFDEKTIMDKCIQIISKNTEEILHHSSFEDIDLNTLMKVLSLDHLNVDSELDLFHAVERYAEAERRRKRQISPVDGGLQSQEPSLSKEKVLLLSVESRPSSSETSPVAELGLNPPSEVIASEPIQADKENVKEEDPIRGALQQIRFLTLSPAQFKDAARSVFLTEAESRAILSNMKYSYSAEPMPNGFSECKKRRQPHIDSRDAESYAEPSSKFNTDCRVFAASELPSPAEIVRGLKSSDRETLWNAACAARQMTCEDDTSENIAELVKAGGVPPLLAALHDRVVGVKYDAAWAITNIAADDVYMMELLNGGAIPKLVALLDRRRSYAVAAQAAWALGNIAGSARSLCEAVVDAGAVPALLAHMQPKMRSEYLVSFLRTYRIICIHLFWGRYVSLSPALGCIENLLVMEADEKVLAEACWVLYHLVSAEQLYPELFTPSLTARLIALLDPDSPATKMQAAALAAAGRILARGVMVDQCIEAGFLDHIINFLQCGNPSLVEYAAYAAANVMGYTRHIQQALDKGLLDVIGPALTEGSHECKNQAAKTICGLAESDYTSQVRMLAASATLEPYCRLLAADKKTCSFVLAGLTSLLEKVEENTLRLKLREIGVPQLLKTVQQDCDRWNEEKATSLLQKYFGDQ